MSISLYPPNLSTRDILFSFGISTTTYGIPHPPNIPIGKLTFNNIMVIVCLSSRHVVDVFVILNEQNPFFIYNHLIKKENLCVSYTYLHVYHLSLMVDKESHMSYVEVNQNKCGWLKEIKNCIYQLPWPYWVVVKSFFFFFSWICFILSL